VPQAPQRRLTTNHHQSPEPLQAGGAGRTRAAGIGGTMPTVLNILTANNTELIAGVTTAVLNAYCASRILRLPPLDPDAHFEHNEAKIAFGLFDGPPPSDHELESFRSMGAADRPAYWNEVEEAIVQIIATFRLTTGKQLAEDKLTLRERGVLWQITLDYAHHILHGRRPRSTGRYPIP
jgi:hypothetical protein